MRDHKDLLSFTPNADKGNDISHVVVVGNGAVKGGWPTVVRFLRDERVDLEFIYPHYLKQKTDNDLEQNASTILARAASMQRQVYTRLVRTHSEIKNGYIKNESLAELCANETKELSKINSFRLALAEHIKNAEDRGEISLRPEFENLLNSINPENTTVITTNWDECVMKKAVDLGIDVIQLHGKASSPQTLILPTENVIDDEYMESFFNNAEEDLINSQLIAIYRNRRSESVYRIFEELIPKCRTAVARAEKITLFGIHGHLYDVELQSIFLGEEKYDEKKIIFYGRDEGCGNWGFILGRSLHVEVTT